MREVDEDPLCRYAFAPEDFISRSISCVPIKVNFPSLRICGFFRRFGAGPDRVTDPKLSLLPHLRADESSLPV